MIIEVVVASLAAVTIAGTWIGCRFAERVIVPPPEERQRAAIALVRRAIEENTLESERRVKALLATDPQALPPDIRARALAWVNRQPFEV